MAAATGSSPAAARRVIRVGYWGSAFWTGSGPPG